MLTLDSGTFSGFTPLTTVVLVVFAMKLGWKDKELPASSPFEKEPAPYLIRGRLKGILS
jgi:hypothetical protein